MQCHNCYKKTATLCQTCYMLSQKDQQLELTKIKQNIEKMKKNINRMLEQQFIHDEKSNPLNLSRILSKKQNFSIQINKIIKKQNTYQKIKKLKWQIQKKKIKNKQLIQKRIKSQNLLKQISLIVQKAQQRILKPAQDQLQVLKQKIKRKQSIMKQLDLDIKFYIGQICDKTLLIINNLYQNSIKFQTKKLFTISKVQQLDFFQYSSNGKSKNQTNKQNQDDFMTKSFYQLQRIQQVKIKSKTNQKGLHIIFLNVLVTKVFMQIFNIWIPYPIDCVINFTTSRLQTKIQQIKICGHKMIDFTYCANLSSNIIQFFPSKIVTKKFKQQKQQDSSSQQDFQLFQTNQFEKYNKRNIQLNKSFINCLQVNIQYLNIKFGIPVRPLIFYDEKLCTQMIKSILPEILYDYKQKQKCKRLLPNYSSMLKQIKLYPLLQSLQQRIKSRNNSELVNQQHTISFKQNIDQINQQPELELEEYQVYQVVTRKPFSELQQSIYQTADILNQVKSSSSNEEFQILR